MLDDDRSSPRERVAAGKALISAGKANLDGIRTAALAKRLGADSDGVAGAKEDSLALKEVLDWLRAENNGLVVDADSGDAPNGHGA